MWLSDNEIKGIFMAKGNWCLEIPLKSCYSYCRLHLVFLHLLMQFFRKVSRGDILYQCDCLFTHLSTFKAFRSATLLKKTAAQVFSVNIAKFLRTAFFIDHLRCLFCRYMCNALRDLVLFVQFKKREKHPWRSVTFSKVAGFSLQLN